MQILDGIILDACCMDDLGKTGKDDLISEFIKCPVEEAQLGRDVRNWTHLEIQKFHDFNTALAIYDLAQNATHKKIKKRDLISLSMVGSNELIVQPFETYTTMLVSYDGLTTYTASGFYQSASSTQHNGNVK